MNELNELLREQKKVKYKMDITELTEINKKIYALREQQRKEYEIKVEKDREERFVKRIEKKCFENEPKKE